MYRAAARYVRILVSWRAIAPATPPSGFEASDPTSPGYSWSGLDSTVKEAESAGLTPILDVISTPRWAYSHRPSGVNAGSPKIIDLGDFARALATHYDGENGRPQVNVYEVWNEPNLSLDLDPASASGYRGMVNAVADAVHAVDPDNLVVAGGLDPVGSAKGSNNRKWYSVAPLTFMRSLLCLSAGAHPHPTCKTPVRFDVWSHHPYTFGGPFRHAKLAGDVMLGDLPRMRALLRTGVRLHRIVSVHPVQFWVTEFGWDTSPPRPHAAPLDLAARWTAESMYQMWRSGVSLVTWFLLDDFPSPSPWQSGLYFHASSLEHARAKPGLTAFRFPFVAYLGKHGSVSIWGRDATSDKETVTIQLRHGKSGHWRFAGLVTSNANGIFQATLRLKAAGRDWLRASAPGSGNSLAFSLTRPRHTYFGPWGS